MEVNDCREIKQNAVAKNDDEMKWNNGKWKWKKCWREVNKTLKGSEKEC